MDNLSNYRQVIEDILTEYAAIPYSYGDIKTEPVFDRERDRYLLMDVGWDKRRVHGCLVHFDIINEKIWIQRDGTEQGMATKLEAAGIPRERIVLAFYRPKTRLHTGYAIN